MKAVKAFIRCRKAEAVISVLATAPDSADFYGCRMPEHSHIRLDKPGNCPECNMKLVPMRLENKTNM